MSARDLHYTDPDGARGPAWEHRPGEVDPAPSDVEQTLIDGRGVRRRVDPAADGPRDRRTAGHRTTAGSSLRAVPTWSQAHAAAEPEAGPWEPPRTMPPRPEPAPEPPAPMVLTEADLHAIADMLACYTLTPERLHRLVRDAVHAERHAFAAETVRLLLGRGKARVRRALRLHGKNTMRGNTR